MTDQPEHPTQEIPDDAPGSAMFPEFGGLYALIEAEVDGLTDEQLDWTSERWGWAEWSIRRQASHMASLLFRWMLLRWGDTLFPDGEHGVEDLYGLAQSPTDRALDASRYHDIGDILAKLQEGIALTQRVLAERNVGFLRSNTLTVEYSPTRAQMNRVYPNTTSVDADAGTETTSLEATIRHMYFEETTHLYNIQRLKRAQGLPTVVETPPIGYHMLDGWDRSEP